MSVRPSDRPAPAQPRADASADQPQATAGSAAERPTSPSGRLRSSGERRTDDVSGPEPSPASDAMGQPEETRQTLAPDLAEPESTPSQPDRHAGPDRDAPEQAVPQRREPGAGGTRRSARTRRPSAAGEATSSSSPDDQELGSESTVTAHEAMEHPVEGVSGAPARVEESVSPGTSPGAPSSGVEPPSGPVDAADTAMPTFQVRYAWPSAETPADRSDIAAPVPPESKSETGPQPRRSAERIGRPQHADQTDISAPAPPESTGETGPLHRRSAAQTGRPQHADRLEISAPVPPESTGETVTCPQ